MEAEATPSLKFLCTKFLQLGSKPHLLWLSCGSSPTAVRAATVQARILSGRYKDGYLRSKYTEIDGSCQLRGCGIFPGDVAHLLSGKCVALRPHLSQTSRNCLSFLRESPYLHSIVMEKLNGSTEDWVGLLIDPSTVPSVIRFVQCQGQGQLAMWPLFRLSRAMIWSMHKNRYKMLGLEQFL